MPSLDLILLFLVFLTGACFGSFGNVLVSRLPNEESVLGRSFCQSCGFSIPWKYNIPILSYFLLRGRCANCTRRFSIRYPIIEFVTAALFTLLYVAYGQSWITLEYIILSYGLLIGSIIDFEHMIIPDEITLGGLVVGLIGAYLNPERNFMEGLWGALLGGGSLWLVAYVYYVFTGREGLGGGDVKLLAFIGSVLGWKSIAFVVLCSSLLGAVVGIVASSKSKEGLRTAIPFGPFISIAALLYIAGLKSVGIWYLQLFFPDI